VTVDGEGRTEAALDPFVEELERFKRDERPEATLLLTDDAALTKIVIAWSTMDVDRREADAIERRRHAHGLGEPAVLYEVCSG
jgi:hypothetical protein